MLEDLTIVAHIARLYNSVVGILVRATYHEVFTLILSRVVESTKLAFKSVKTITYCLSVARCCVFSQRPSDC